MISPVVDHAAFSGLSSKETPVFAREGEWMTATWQDGNLQYLLVAQGDRALLEHYLTGTSSGASTR